MAVDKKISQLASGAPAQAGDEYVVARSGANFKLTLTNIAASMPPIGATTPNSGAFTTLSASSGETISGGNLTFSSTAQRITGDMSTTTFANRLSFQTSGTNLVTSISALPNGTATGSNANFYNNSDPTNASLLLVGANLSETIINSTIRGTGSYLPMTFYTGGSERVRIDTSGNVGIGTASPGKKLEVFGDIRANSAGANEIQLSTTSSSTSTAHIIGALSNSGFDYANLIISSNTTRFNISGSERMRIDSSGNVGIGGTPTANRKLELLGSFPVLGGNANSNGIYPVLEVPSAITGSAYVFRTGPSIAASTATTNVFHYLAANVALGSGASLTNSYGFYADAMTSATNNYGFYSNIASGSNRWNFYAAGTAANYFAGDVGIGTASPNAKFNVLSADNAATTVIASFDANNASQRIQIGYNRIAQYANTAGISFYTNGINGTERMTITNTGNVVAGGSVALATTATDGFLYVPTCAGTPTGTPTAITGMAPIVVNTTNNKLYFYSGGAWRDAGP
jgi:hypothetical protein